MKLNIKLRRFEGVNIGGKIYIFISQFYFETADGNGIGSWRLTRS